ncbi:MAG: GIY-YIG nuclease family protein [Candidatus Paceibacterota bacterium]|jgi:hypothetical protein
MTKVSNPPIKQFLYWVTTRDGGENWFIVAKTDASACSFHEAYEGYSSGDAKARKISSVPLKYCRRKPYHAQLDLLEKLGFTILSDDDVRVVRKNGKIYREGCVVHVILFEIGEEQGPGVYLVRASGTKKFKIGIAKNFKKRFRDLQTGSSEELEPCCFYPTKKREILENYLHRKFKKNSIGREWFEFNLEDMSKVHAAVLKFLNYSLIKK